jgi:hypothetical protein
MEPMDNFFKIAYVLGVSIAARVYSMMRSGHLWYADQDQEIFDENPDGHGLMIVLNGYKASRANVYRQIQIMRQTSNKQYRALYVPHVHYERNMDIATANSDIFTYIQEFCRDNPREPILIVGISAGGRLAVRLENVLRREPAAVHVVTIGSPLNGTSLVRLLPGFRILSSLMVGSTLVEEFDPLSAAQSPIAEAVFHSDINRTYCHFYSTSDHMVFPPYRCVATAELPKARTYALHGCAHHDMFTHPDVIRYLETFRFDS